LRLANSKMTFEDDKVAKTCLLNDDEWPMLIVKLNGSTVPRKPLDNGEPQLLGGRPNQLSDEQIAYASIEKIHASTKLLEEPCDIERKAEAHAGSALPPSASTNRSFGEVVRARRSALDFRGGTELVSLPQLPGALWFSCISTSTGSMAWHKGSTATGKNTRSWN